MPALPGFSKEMLSRLGLKRKNLRRADHAAPRDRRLRLEPLEDRRVLAVMTVTSLGDGPATGNADGFLSLREAIHALNVGSAVDGIGPTSGSFGVDDRIVFAPNVVGMIQLLAAQGELLIENEMVVEGPGAELLTIRAEDPSGELGDGHRVIRVAHPEFGTNDGVEIIGLTITGGDTPFAGGGILTEANLTVRGSVIFDNSAFGGGGIGSNGTAELVVVGSVIDSNFAHSGGGIFVNGTLLTLSQTQVINNAANQLGAGIASYGSIVALPEEATIIIENSQINDNVLVGDVSQAGGGGLHVVITGTLEIYSSEISRNVAGHQSMQHPPDGLPIGSGRGGGIHSGALSGTIIQDCLISHNVSKGEGGGAYLPYSPGSKIVNTTISHNSAEQGGGLSISDAQVLHCTIAYNDAGNMDYPEPGYDDPYVYSAGGGGILIHRSGFFRIEGWDIHVYEAVISHTIVAGNTHPVGLLSSGIEIRSIGNNGSSPDIGFVEPLAYIPAIDRANFENPLNVRYSLIGNTAGPLSGGEAEDPTAIVALSGPGVITNVDPQLGSLQDNGGFKLPDGSTIRTMGLNASSQAIDAGDPLFVAPPEFDQRGAPFDRVYDWPGVGPEDVSRIDIGAFELQPAPALAGDADFNDDGYVDGADFLIWQRGFGTINATPAQGDADNDADVDGDDLAIWKETFGTVVPAPVVPAQIAAIQSAVQNSPPSKGWEQPSMIASGDHAQGGSPREAMRGGIHDRRLHATAENPTFNPYLTGETLAPIRLPQAKPSFTPLSIVDQPAPGTSGRIASLDPVRKSGARSSSESIGEQNSADWQSLLWQDLDEVFSQL